MIYSDSEVLYNNENEWLHPTAWVTLTNIMLIKESQTERIFTGSIYINTKVGKQIHAVRSQKWLPWEFGVVSD